MQLLIDPIRKRVLADLRTESDFEFANFEYGETIPIEIALIDKIVSNPEGRLWEPRILTGWNFRAALGLPFQPVLSGFYTLTYGANTTDPIAVGADADTVALALADLVSVVAAGGIVVTGPVGYFTFTFNNPGARTELTSNVSDVAPVAVGEHATLVDGDVDTAEVQTFRLFRNAAAFNDINTDGDDAAAVVDVVSVGGGGANHSVRVRLTPINIYKGGWALSIGGEITDLMPFNASKDEVRQTLEGLVGMAVGDVAVVKESDGQWLISFQGAHSDEDMGVIGINGLALVSLPIKSGILDLRTPGVEQMLGANSQVEAIFEIEGTPPAGTPQKLFRWPLTIFAPIITPGMTTPTPIVQFYTKAEVDALITSMVFNDGFGIFALDDDWDIEAAGAVLAFRKTGSQQMRVNSGSSIFEWRDTAITAGTGDMAKLVFNGGMVAVDRAVQGSDYLAPAQGRPPFITLVMQPQLSGKGMTCRMARLFTMRA
jgi:hypothetical protein